MGLGEKLRGAMDSLRKAAVFDKTTIKEAVKEIQRALIAADVEVKLVLELSKRIEKEAAREKLPAGLSRREHVVKVTYDALVELIGGTGKKLPEKPKKILLVGLFGAGKTTTVAKLAKYYMKRGMKVGVIAADTYRPAAFEQLEQLTGKGRIAFFGIKKEKRAAKVIEKALKEMKGFDLLIADSAGRNAFDKDLVKEIKEINSAFKPEEKWLVLGADIGQLAKKQATAFHDAVGVNGVIITRIDGSAKGGGALSACHVAKCPVYFLGTGEKLDDLQEFDAERYLGRIMGYGDLQALLEKAKEVTEEEELSPEELLKGEFNLDTFYKQLKATRKMGPLTKVAEMLGMKMQMPKEMLEMTEEKLDGFKVMMDSMTKEEKLSPDTMNRSRIQRIAKGSGTSENQVRELLKAYKQMSNVFKKFRKLDEKALQKKGGLDMQKLAQMFGKKKKKKFRIR
ncbi:MAG: signal recognition particle protein [Candidatus Diapherotrites archaeon]|uniref:Signal recognition particle 54 kDa protein n=1 Tax=Candidatus Iainarchaeum sp. TaxID=3101447 RepID=A0A938YU23_9ARCH|nr:signal recognition particle protein [Candidatus Diapherotrites archaeon]